MKRVRLWMVAGALLAAGAMVATFSPSAAGVHPVAATTATSQHVAINCAVSRICADVVNSDEYFGKYVGHDEPSALFYSNKPGAGNRMQYSLTLPKDPSPSHPGKKSYQFELNGSFWFGLAMCDTQSWPEQLSTCKPDSDSNIVDPAVSPVHSGMAFTEMQFYAPGWIPWPTWSKAVGANGCDPTKWCAALNIDSLSIDPVNGTIQNAACAAQAGIEYVNFAFITKNGHSQAPANPVQSTLATFTPNRAKDLFMNSGDRLKVTFKDTHDGLKVTIADRTTGQTGSMTASAANGFAQVKYDPTGSSCTAIPYNFHPMYSTSSEQTRVTWAAHTYNVSFASEIGHFQTCTGPTPIPATPFGFDSGGNPITCPAGNTEGSGSSARPTDSDDNFCFPGSEAMRVHVSGCTDTNTGFDGLNYQPVYPDGNTKLHPQPILFSSPLTGKDFNSNYPRMGFEADLPNLEAGCDVFSGAGCTLIPADDTGNPAPFYPFFSAFGAGKSHGCRFGFGNTMPGGNSFGKNAQYGSLLSVAYPAGPGGAGLDLILNFRQVFSTNPCRA